MVDEPDLYAKYWLGYNTFNVRPRQWENPTPELQLASEKRRWFV